MNKKNGIGIVIAIFAFMGSVQAKPVPGIKGLPAFTGQPVAEAPALLMWPEDQKKNRARPD